MTVDEAINEQIEKVAPPVRKATPKEVNEYGEPDLKEKDLINDPPFEPHQALRKAYEKSMQQGHMDDARRYYEM